MAGSSIADVPHRRLDHATYTEFPTDPSIVSSPNTSTNQDNDLNGISCPTSTLCVAAGEYWDSSHIHAQTLIEQWDGTTWIIATSPNAGSVKNFLFGMHCPSVS